MSYRLSQIKIILSIQKELIEIKTKVEQSILLLDDILIKTGKRSYFGRDIVAEIVCSVFGINFEDFIGKSRNSNLVNARHIYSHIVVDYLGDDITESMNFINRDRSVYYNNKDRHEAYYGRYDEYTQLYDKVLKKVQDLENEKRKSENQD